MILIDQLIWQLYLTVDIVTLPWTIIRTKLGLDIWSNKNSHTRAWIWFIDISKIWENGSRKYRRTWLNRLSTPSRSFVYIYKGFPPFSYRFPRFVTNFIYTRYRRIIFFFRFEFPIPHCALIKIKNELSSALTINCCCLSPYFYIFLILFI